MTNQPPDGKQALEEAAAALDRVAGAISGLTAETARAVQALEDAARASKSPAAADVPPFASAEEDALARAAFDRLKAETETEESVPLELVRRIHEGESPVKVWRQHRGLTQSALAEAVGLRQGSLSDLERGRSTASFDTYCRLADALGIELGDLRPPAR